ncbi:MAG: hypothetical protein NC092_07950 [Butyrivibrio sp.]|nr:hypothetical protein [Muribaculum sp.]MCM1552607.1 hypothetical protein [Butyrivibrio sp.]
MKKDKDMQLVNIYIKIHNKKPLLMDDLAYLAKYNPECFKKTCDNLIYNIPEAKMLVESADDAPKPEPVPEQNALEETGIDLFRISEEERAQMEASIAQFLENLKGMEVGEVDTLQSVDVARVKDLVGNLYMEKMFPHSGMPEYFEIHKQEAEPTFNVRA